MAQVVAQPDIDTLFEAGAHFGRSKSRRHPTAAPFIFGVKDKNDIFDLTQTAACLAKALEAVAKVAGEGKQILFVGGKSEVASIVKSAAERVGAPHVAGRWIGGTLTNFKQIRKRVDRLVKLTGEKERGELEKYTKRERLLIDREIEELEHRFRGIVDMGERPGMVFVVDTRQEHIAIKEAVQMGVPVIGLANSDCDFGDIAFPIPANDSSIRSVSYFVNAIADAFWAYKKAAPAKEVKRKAE
jgi:small subunit ribosomal protein S2